jgi:hypothetical protein
MLAPLAGRLGLSGWAAAYLPEVVALVFTVITAALLVEDLARPLRFYRLLTRPNWGSWLVKGGVILGAFGAVSAGIIALRMLGWDDAADGLRKVEAVGGVLAAAYTAFLFDQCEGRDLWQSRWLLPHLLVQALMCGGAALAPFSADPARLGWLIAGAAVAHWAIACVERWTRHATANATQGAAFLGTVRMGVFRPWRDGLLVGVGLGVLAAFVAPWLAWVPILAGLYLYEWAYIRAGQLPPLS